MAKIELIKVQEALRAIDGETLTSKKKNEFMTNLGYTERSTKTMSGIGAKIDGLTITLFDAADFEAKMGEFLDNQEFPLAQGYMWIEENKLSEYVLQKKYKINPGDITVETVGTGTAQRLVVKTPKTTTGGGVGTRRSKNTNFKKAAKDIQTDLEIRNPLLKTLNQFKEKETAILFPDVTKYSGTVSGLLNDELKNKILEMKISLPQSATGTINNAKDLLFYDFKDNILTAYEAKVTKYTNRVQSIDDITIISGFYNSQKLDFSALLVPFEVGTEAGHVQGVATKSLRNQIALMENMISVGEGILDISAELKNKGLRTLIPANVRKSSSYTIDKSTIIFLEKVLEKAKEVLKQIIILDRIFLSAKARFSPDLDKILSEAKVYLAAAGEDQAVFIREITPGNITLDKVDIGVAYAMESLIPEDWWNGKKGGDVGGVIAAYRAYLTNLAVAIRNSLQNPTEVEKIVKEQGSSSILEILVLRSLDRIFNTKSFSSLIRKRRGTKKDTVRFRATKKSKTRIKFAKKIFKLVNLSQSKKGKSTRRREVTTLTQQTQNIVPVLNAELKRYVLEQMSYPSLENRSGRFASSVRVLSAQEDAAVQYTYQKSPYQVFSQARGKSPWNDRQERDPAQIIDKAIKRIGMDKFGKVFRTEER